MGASVSVLWGGRREEGGGGQHPPIDKGETDMTNTL